MKKIIPIVLCSDNNYAKYLSVTLLSILSNSKKSTFCDFYILTSHDFSEKNKKIIENDARRFENNKITFVSMQNKYKNIKITRSHLATPTFYRLSIADILPKKYKKCLYFDTDVIVNIDLQELFDINIGNNAVAGTKDPGV
ncbi:MAG: hypothetical protein HUJ68_00500 [Clostridia bacterium]|nr:hypothetical protein [Clostridia bacterium]